MNVLSLEKTIHFHGFFWPSKVPCKYYYMLCRIQPYPLWSELWHIVPSCLHNWVNIALTTKVLLTKGRVESIQTECSRGAKRGFFLWAAIYTKWHSIWWYREVKMVLQIHPYSKQSFSFARGLYQRWLWTPDVLHTYKIFGVVLGDKSLVISSFEALLCGYKVEQGRHKVAVRAQKCQKWAKWVLILCHVIQGYTWRHLWLKFEAATMPDNFLEMQMKLMGYSCLQSMLFTGFCTTLLYQNTGCSKILVIFWKARI